MDVNASNPGQGQSSNTSQTNTLAEQYLEDHFVEYLSQIYLVGDEIDPGNPADPGDPADPAGPADYADPPILGDIDGSGFIDADDIAMLKEILSGTIEDPTPEQDAASDVNDDGAVDENDLALLKKRVNKGSIDLDLNYDGEVDESDQDLINQYLTDPKEWLFTEKELTKIREALGDAELDQGAVDDYFADRFNEDRLFGDLNNDNVLDEKDLEKAQAYKDGDVILTAAEKIAMKDYTIKGFIKLPEQKRWMFLKVKFWRIRKFL